MYTSNIIKYYEIFMLELYIHKRQFIEFLEKFQILLLLFYNKVANRSLTFARKQLKFLSTFAI